MHVENTEESPPFHAPFQLPEEVKEPAGLALSIGAAVATQQLRGVSSACHEAKLPLYN
jgi:hypothetical protein